MDLASNVACTGENGAVQALAVIPHTREDIRYRYVNFAEPPAADHALEVITKTQEGLATSYEADHLMMVSLHRLCWNRRHAGYPQRGDGRRIRLERIGSYILADDGGRTMDLLLTNQGSRSEAVRSRRGNVYAASPFREELRTLDFPYVLNDPTYSPVQYALEAKSYRSGMSLYVALRGIEQVVERRQLSKPEPSLG